MCILSYRSLPSRMEKHWQQEYDKDSRKCVSPYHLITDALVTCMLIHQSAKSTLLYLWDCIGYTVLLF